MMKRPYVQKRIDSQIDAVVSLKPDYPVYGTFNVWYKYKDRKFFIAYRFLSENAIFPSFFIWKSHFEKGDRSVAIDAFNKRVVGSFIDPYYGKVVIYEIIGKLK